MDENLKVSTTKWYSVKVLFESVHIKNYKTSHNPHDEKLFEESIFLVKAKTEEQAYDIGKEHGIKAQTEYLNYYGETVRWTFIKIIDIFELSDDNIESGTEVYSRFIFAKGNDDVDKVLERYYPESRLEEN